MATKKPAAQIDDEEDDAVDSEHYDDTWHPPGQLEAPPPQDGMVQKWVRTEILGQPDVTNAVKQVETFGWRPRRIDTVPEAERSRFPVFQHAQFGGILKVGSLILCEMPEKRHAKRTAYYDAKRHGLEQSLVDDNITKDNRSAGRGYHPVQIVERNTKVTTRKPTVQADRT